MFHCLHKKAFLRWMEWCGYLLNWIQSPEMEIVILHRTPSGFPFGHSSPSLCYLLSCALDIVRATIQSKDEKYKCPQELLECLILYHFRWQMMNDTQLSVVRRAIPSRSPNPPTVCLSVCPNRELSGRRSTSTTVRHEIICTLQLPLATQLTMATNVPATHNDDRVVNNAYQP